jgi:hypothetical protein
MDNQVIYMLCFICLMVFASGVIQVFKHRLDIEFARDIIQQIIEDEGKEILADKIAKRVAERIDKNINFEELQQRYIASKLLVEFTQKGYQCEPKKRPF